MKFATSQFAEKNPKFGQKNVLQGIYMLSVANLTAFPSLFLKIYIYIYILLVFRKSQYLSCIPRQTFFWYKIFKDNIVPIREIMQLASKCKKRTQQKKDFSIL